MKYLYILLLLALGLSTSCEQDNDTLIIEEPSLSITKPDNIISVLDAAALYDEYESKRAFF